MFKEHGSVEALEVAVSKKNSREQKTSKAGGWYTKSYLEQHEFWNKSIPQSFGVGWPSHPK